jgi:galactokinase/mevalonate kinase-like predicted kinase
MRITVSAPGRAGIIGNPTDMYGGMVLSCTIPSRAYATIEPAEQLTLVDGNGVIVAVRTQRDLERKGDSFDLARAALKDFGGQAMRATLYFSTHVLHGAGLAGSTALLAAIWGALWRFQHGVKWDSRTMAERIRSLEYHTLGITCGFQDAHMVAFGGLQWMQFTDRSFDERMPGPPVRLEDISERAPDLPFVLAHTGQIHSSHNVHSPTSQRWLDGEREVVEGYRQIASIAVAGRRALLAGDWPALGILMNQNHAIQRDLGGSSPANERLIDTALRAGALGAKLAGAGGGGTIIALTPDPGPVITALQAVGAAHILRLRPGPGARIEAGSAA